ncbi:hypothetical protein V1478_017550 [Vespula squamosa]|uniref:Uncharacterized protein n=1 Tax=Vespula squamosa TaxID=30214 RepID=A0ABD1ZX56_VESSQ
MACLKIILRNLIDIFCSTSVRSSTLQNSSKDIIPSPFSSASTIVRSAMLFNLLGLFFLIGLKCANTCINCKKLTLSLPLSSKKAFTILSPRGFIASSGILRKSSRLNVPQSPRSRLFEVQFKILTTERLKVCMESPTYQNKRINKK